VPRVQETVEKAFVDSFTRVDDEVGGKVVRGGGGKACTSDAAVALVPEPVAPETVGSTVVAAVVCSSHTIVPNCGDSQAVLQCSKHATSSNSVYCRH